MSQVAVVIGGGQTLGEFLCRGLAAEGYRVAVVDIQSEKAARVADAINTEFGEGVAYGFGADATSEQSVMALARGVDEIFGRTDLLAFRGASFRSTPNPGKWAASTTPATARRSLAAWG